MVPVPSVPGGVLALAGPTGAGKSEVALLLTERLKGEIISVDSMQVYRGLDIGTAKPSLEERARIPHHLIDVVDLLTGFDAAQFVRLAWLAAEQISRRGRLPILCGGTGLYFKAFCAGLGTAPPSLPAVRVDLEKRSAEELLHELARCDPVTYERIDRGNVRRIIRAVEVIRITGQPFSAQRADWQDGSSQGVQRMSFFGLQRTPEDLRQRIEARVDAMFQRGLVAETEALLKAGLKQNRAALQAIGYRQVVEHLEGVRSLPETVDLVKSRTRQFAKRQMTWFRRQLPMTWIPVRHGETAESIARVIAEKWSTLLER